MEAQTSFSLAQYDFAAELLAEPGCDGRAHLLAQRVAFLVPSSAIVVYLHQNGEWRAAATSGDVSLQASDSTADAATLARLFERRQPVVFTGADLPREAYAHLNVRRTVVSLACIPLQIEQQLVGAIECLTFEQPITDDALETLRPVAGLSAIALYSALNAERERNESLHSISRLAQLYDIEKVFNSTLDIDAIQPIITSKLQEVLDVQAVNLWLVAEDDKLKLVSQAGADASVEVGSLLEPGPGIPNDVAEDGEPVLAGADDERVQARDAARGKITGIMAAALLADGALLGVVEAINKRDGRPFDEDDLFFLTNLCEATSGALNNASRFYAERKVEILQTLVNVSREITATLNLDRVLQTVVNGPSAVIPNERTAIALEKRGKFQISAISGEHEVNPGDENVKRLSEILHWASDLNEELYIRQVGDEVNHPRAETRAKFQRYFENSGMRAFFCLPLTDDEGRVGILSLESSDPEFLSPAHREMLRVLAGQATVALRNAQLYRDVPFINVLEPVMQKKQKFMAMPRNRRVFWTSAAVAVLVILAVVPVPMRVSGAAEVGPVRRAMIEPQFDGTVSRVYVHEGQFVHRGDILGDLADWNDREALAGAKAKYETALAQMNRALTASDGSEAGTQRLQADYWNSEVQRARERLELVHLRAPIDGWVTTPHMENLVGRHLDAGDPFAEVEDASHAIVDVAVDEGDLPLLNSGAKAVVKLNGFPMRVFKGEVAVLSPKSTQQGQARYFYARVNTPNPDGAMRPGMQGKCKISVGWRPVGYVLFRRPSLWAYEKIWSLMGW
ncbi:MAG TPA: GAF domain-containing protein [candidate division Zixibacteria bacterium]|nr:GAF domain-containing protein [candidate division Zixibacteria bacterium]